MIRSLALAIFLSACGPSLVLCSRDTCDGCCDQNRCLAGTAATFCGVDGNACAACTSAQVCGRLGCEARNRVCDSSTCSGCCDGNGQCVTGQLASACGSGGTGCGVCNQMETCQPIDTSSTGGACR